MFKLCFYQRLALSLVAVFILIVAVLFWTTSYLQQQTRLEAEQRLHVGLAGHLVEDNPLLSEGVYDYAALKNLFHTLMILGPSFEFYYLDPQGKLITYSAPRDHVISESIDIEPLRNLINDATELPILGDDPKQQGVKKIFSAAPVYHQGQLQGYLYVILGGEIYDSITRNLQFSENWQEWALFALSSLVFLLIALLILFKFFTRPLRILSDDMDRIREAEFHAKRGSVKREKWRRDSHNEVHRLGSAFNDMLDHIDNQFEQLQRIDQQRRVLLTDLSHDLRTPLANLQGYIETLHLNGEKLTAEDRQRFVDISLKNAKNLKRLIDQIFELTYLEGGQVTLNQETFPLGELLHDIVAKFNLKAQEKDITLTVVPSQFEYQVFADIGKLERVLTNLLENAIRHTPEGGTITLSVTPLSGKLRIDIRDTGIGISETEIAFIFDARYQASNSRKDSSLHAGLGLAISKKLMALLESDLEVQSELGKGTCFSFELNRA